MSVIRAIALLSQHGSAKAVIVAATKARTADLASIHDRSLLMREFERSRREAMKRRIAEAEWTRDEFVQYTGLRPWVYHELVNERHVGPALVKQVSDALDVFNRTPGATIRAERAAIREAKQRQFDERMASLLQRVVASGMSKQTLYDFAGLSWPQIERFYTGGSLRSKAFAAVEATVSAWETTNGDRSMMANMLSGRSFAPDGLVRRRRARPTPERQRAVYERVLAAGWTKEELAARTGLSLWLMKRLRQGRDKNAVGNASLEAVESALSAWEALQGRLAQTSSDGNARSVSA